MDRSSQHSSGTHTPRNSHSSRRDRTSENRPTPYDTRKTSHQSSHIMNNAGGNSIQFNGTANVRTLKMTGPEPPPNRVVDLSEHAARPPSLGTRHSSAQISNDDGGGVTGVRISGSPRAGNNPQQRDAGLNGELTHAAGPNIAPGTAPAPAPAQPPGFDNMSLTHAVRRGSSEAGYHQQPQGGHTVEQTHAPGTNIGSALFSHAGGYPLLDDIDHLFQYDEFDSSAQMNAVTSRPYMDDVQTHAVPGSSTAAPSSTVAQQHSPQLWDNTLSQASEKRS